MSRSPRRVRSVHHRTLGSGTRLVDEMQIPAGLYYGGRGVAWAARHWRVTGPVAFFLVLWSGVGLVAAVLLFGVLAGGCLTGWLVWRSRGAEGSRGSVGISAQDLRLRATLRKQWPLACRTAKLLGPETGEAPKLAKLSGNGHGTLTATVESGRIGVPVFDIQKQTARLADVIGCREVVVSPKGPGVAHLSFHWRDPIGRVLPLAELPIAPDAGHLAYGIRQDGSVATIQATQSVLIGGLTRAGKSSVVRSLLGDALRQGLPVDLYVSDPKGGVELAAFEAGLGRQDGLIRVRQYAKTPADTVKMIEAAEKAMHARQHWLRENGDGATKIIPNATNPLVVIILDETLPLTDLLKKGTDSALGRIAYTGSALAYVVWANTQVAQIDALGRFRDLIPQRMCFATSSPQVADAVLGMGAEGQGARCSDINEAGVGFSYAEGDKGYRKFRAALVTDAETREIAQGRLPAKVANAAMEAYDRREESAAGKSRGDRRTALYRWFYVDSPEYGDSLGYVGISYDVLRREQQHSAGLRAFMEGNVRREVVYYATRGEAEAAEKLAIETERPIHNVVHNEAVRRFDRLRRRDKVA